MITWAACNFALKAAVVKIVGLRLAELWSGITHSTILHLLQAV